MLSNVRSRLIVLAFKNFGLDLDCSTCFLSQRKVKLILFVSFLNILYLIASKRVVIVRFEVIAICPVLGKLRLSIMLVLPRTGSGLAFYDANFIVVTFVT